MSTEQKNTDELKKINNRIYAIAQEYGSNTDERYDLLTAYDRIHDAVASIETNQSF